METYLPNKKPQNTDRKFKYQPLKALRFKYPFQWYTGCMRFELYIEKRLVRCKWRSTCISPVIQDVQLMLSVHSADLRICRLFIPTAKGQISLHKCAVWSEHLLATHSITKQLKGNSFSKKKNVYHAFQTC